MACTGAGGAIDDHRDSGDDHPPGLGGVPARTDWVRVASLPSRTLAGFVASALEDAGLRARVVADDGGGVLPHLDTLTGGAHVEVPREDAEPAGALLEDVQRIEQGTEDPHVPTVTWRSVAVALLVIALLVAVGGVFLR